MSEKNTKAFVWAGVTVELDSYNHQFYVPSLEKHYETAQQAKDAIERAGKAKTAAAKVKLSLAVVNDKGKALTVTGLHAGSGKFLTTPKSDRFDRDREFYVGAEVVRKLIAERARLRALASGVDDQLADFRLTSYESYDFKADDLPACYANLAKDHMQKMADAAATTFDGAMKKAADGIDPSDLV